MSLIYENFLKNIKRYPNKIFIYDLKKSYSGKVCLGYLNKIEKFIRLNKIKNIGIKSINSFHWIIWYLASDKNCEKVFIIKNNTKLKILNKLKKKYKIDYITTNTKKKLSKFQKKYSRNLKKRQDILFTSGTTDFPKGVIIDDKSFLHVIKILTKKFKQSKSDLELLSMPFDHSFGLVRLRCCLYLGCQMLISDGLKNFPNIYSFGKKNKITGLSLVPSGIELIKVLLKKKVREFSENLKYFEIGSSSLNKRTRIWLKNNFKYTNILHHYGMTEASRSFLIKRGNKDKLNLNSNIIGNIIPGCKYKIDDKKNNGRGELLLKGKNLFHDYVDHKETANKLKGKWFRTGDICEKKGRNIKLIGRIDNQFNIGGDKIQAEFIENKIESLNCVKKCLCFQVNDHIYGKKIAIMVEKKISIKKKYVNNKINILFKKYPDYYTPETILFKRILLTKNKKKIRNLRY